MTYSFSLPGVTLSQNELDGKHWTVKQSQKESWHEAVGYGIGRCPREPREGSLHVVRVSKRVIDPLNVYAGLKWLLDALVLMGWFPGDGYGQVEVTADQRKCEKGEEPHMELTITYADRS